MDTKLQMNKHTKLRLRGLSVATNPEENEARK